MAYRHSTYDQRHSTDGQTCWSHHLCGDVEIPEICVYSIDSRCHFEETGCKRLHAKWPYHWQMKYDGKYGEWINFLSFQSQELEEYFQDPARNECSITPIDINMLEPSAREHYKVLGAEKWKANFKLMIIWNDSDIYTYKIRRLSTHSAAISKSPKATVFEWYCQDNNYKWTKYVDSDFIENLFINEGKRIVKLNNDAGFEYELDFSKMIQRNLVTSREREVRRRPKRKVEINVNLLQLNNKEIDGLPTYWDPMQNSDSLIRVLLTPPQREYFHVERLLTTEIFNATVISIYRIQNPFLWRPLQNKMDELLLKYGSEQKLNMQLLYHGTKFDNIDNICKENFDWRLHGTSTGQLYGRGTYFSNSTAYSHDYSKDCDSSTYFMMVARVLVGYITKGDSSMTRPPKNPITGMLYDTTVDNESNPKIFVKYDKQEYYPEYVIEYRANLPYKFLFQQTPSNNSKPKATVISSSSTMPENSSKSLSHEWFFFDDNSQWIKYVNSDDIEIWYKSNKPLAYRFYRFNNQYELNFLRMSQKNLNTGKERAVKREPKEGKSSSSTTKTGILKIQLKPNKTKKTKKSCTIL